jgi:hypothetical protein
MNLKQDLEIGHRCHSGFRKHLPAVRQKLHITRQCWLEARANYWWQSGCGVRPANVGVKH